MSLKIPREEISNLNYSIIIFILCFFGVGIVFYLFTKKEVFILFTFPLLFYILYLVVKYSKIGKEYLKNIFDYKVFKINKQDDRLLVIPLNDEQIEIFKNYFLSIKNLNYNILDLLENGKNFSIVLDKNEGIMFSCEVNGDIYYIYTDKAVNEDDGSFVYCDFFKKE